MERAVFKIIRDQDDVPGYLIPQMYGDYLRSGNPAEMRLSWRYGISKNVLEKKLRTGEVANWLEYQVLPTRAKRGRG